MRFGVWGAMLLWLSLVFACGVDVSEPPSASEGREASAVDRPDDLVLAAELARAESSSAALGVAAPVTAAATCTSHCNCPLWQKCSGGLCVDVRYPGPMPPSPPCMADCQCAARSYCTASGTSWGFCVAPTCSLAWSASTVPPNGSANFIISSTQMPANSYLRLYGTRNGVVDANGDIWNLVSGTFGIPNTPGTAGVYVRYVRMYSPTNRLLCESNTVTVTFQ